MSDNSDGIIPRETFDHPLLATLSDMASELAGIRFMVVFPDKGGWSQCYPGSVATQPDFCRLIQSAGEGAKHCKTCHVLMSVAARRSGLIEQRCHAGVSVLVMPVPDAGSDEVFSVLSTCTFTSPAMKKKWQETKMRGKKLGIDLTQLKKTFEELPVLNPGQERIARTLLKIAGEAVQEIKTRMLLQKEVMKSRDHTNVKSVVVSAVEQRLKVYPPLAAPLVYQAKGMASRACGASVSWEKGRRPKKTISRKKMPVLIRVVEDLVRRRPDIPYNVAELAAAARITPNHFSSLFHDYTGQTFSEFLCEKRIAVAKSLLGDLTLNISEVALRAGYRDAGYFTRRFRHATGAAPRAWREKLSVAPR